MCRKILFITVMILFFAGAAENAYSQKIDDPLRPVKILLQKQQFLSAQAGIHFPMGGWSDMGWSTGFGINGSYNYMISQSIGLHLLTGYNNFWEYENSRYDEELDMRLTHHMEFSTIPIQAGGTIYLGNMYDFNPYAGAELGLHYTTSSWGVDIEGDTPPFPIDISSISDGSESNLNFGFSVFAGLLYPLGERLSLNANIKYTWIFDKSECEEDYGEWNSVKYLSINAGISYFL